MQSVWVMCDVQYVWVLCVCGVDGPVEVLLTFASYCRHRERLPEMMAFNLRDAILCCS